MAPARKAGAASIPGSAQRPAAGFVFGDGVRHPFAEILGARFRGRVGTHPFRRALAAADFTHPLPEFGGFAWVVTGAHEQIEADLEERGSVYVTGSNQKGQLGLGDKEPRRYFTVVRPLRGVGVVYVACSADMCYAVTEEHDVYVWGGAGVGRTGLNPALMKRSVTDSAVINNWMEPQLVPDLAGEEVSGIFSHIQFYPILSQ